MRLHTFQTGSLAFSCLNSPLQADFFCIACHFAARVKYLFRNNWVIFAYHFASGVNGSHGIGQAKQQQPSRRILMRQGMVER